MVEGSSTAAWKDVTVSMNSFGYRRGASVFVSVSSEITWSMKTTFTANALTAGGVMYAVSSTIGWKGEETAFSINNALHHGGAIMMGNVLSLCWNGETGFIINTAGGAADAVHALNSFDVYWPGKATFVNNSLYVGGAVMVESLSVVSWDGETVFSSNTATYSGGAVNVFDGSTAS